MNDDDKELDKTLNRLIIGGAALVGLLVLAGTYNAGYRSGTKEIKAPITVHDNVIINNHSNNSSQPTHLDK